MCTVTLVPRGAGGGARLACNRDELRTRPAALPPRPRRFGPRRAVLPADATSGGTWVAANDAGLALALLNVNKARRPMPRPPALSRGLLIPALLHCDNLDDATRLAARLAPAGYAPFRLVLADRHRHAEVVSAGEEVRVAPPTRLTEPVLFTSSGLGDHVVAGPRRRLFADCFRLAGDRPGQQDAFHCHSWPDRTHLSVCMRRPDARTVSHTVVELGADAVVLTYYPDAPDRPVPPVTVTLDLRPAGDA